MSRIVGVLNEMRQVLPAVVAVGGTVFLIIYVGCLVIGKCYLTYDSVITEIGICLDTSYRPVTEVPRSTQQIYICGLIEGTTPRPGGLYLFYEGKVLSTSDFDQHPGRFFQPLRTSQELKPGAYRVEIGYARRILAQTEFYITDN
jgi:hypothetical protein